MSSSESGCAIAVIVILYLAVMFVSISFVKYKYYTEKYIEEYLSQCVKINEETIQCPIPK